MKSQHNKDIMELHDHLNMHEFVCYGTNMRYCVCGRAQGIGMLHSSTHEWINCTLFGEDCVPMETIWKYSNATKVR